MMKMRQEVMPYRPDPPATGQWQDGHNGQCDQALFGQRMYTWTPHFGKEAEDTGKYAGVKEPVERGWPSASWDEGFIAFQESAIYSLDR